MNGNVFYSSTPTIVGKNENRYFYLSTGDKTYVIPQIVSEGSDAISFSSSWTKVNLPGSTEPMVAFNYVDAPTLSINLKFHEDLWNDNGLGRGGYLEAISGFASVIYPSNNGDVINPPYCTISCGNSTTYRGYFTSTKINMTGVIRNGYRTTCEISGSFVVIKKSSPVKSGVANSYRTYFSS